MNKIVTQISPERTSVAVDAISSWKQSPGVLEPFDNRTIEFLDSLSKVILNSSELNRVAEIVALAFWLRKANINSFIKENSHLTENKNESVSPVGRVFHICPSNVDTMFMYSFAISILMGNKNILRISQREGSPHLNTLFDVINAHVAKEENKLFCDYFNIITYEHDAEINTYFSMHADARVIWGGDETIRTFKSFPVSPGTKDIVFADRVSYALFKSAAFLSLSEKEKSGVAEKFYNDSYSFNQKGCSCPQAIFILGNSSDNKKFSDQFYDALKKVVLRKYDTDVYSLASLKLNQLAGDAMEEKISSVYEDDCRIVFAELEGNSITSGSCGGGLFYTKSIEQLKDFVPFIHSKVQTVGFFGLNENEIKSVKELSSGKGIDRLVPVGKALDFHYLWDGYNLFDELCRKSFIL